MAKKKTEVATDFDSPVVVDGGVNMNAVLENVVETDPAIINPYTADLQWQKCHPINHAGLLFVYPKMFIDLDGTVYSPETVLVTTPILERIYALPKVTFDFLFGNR